MTRSRANLWRYPPGARGRRHIDHDPGGGLRRPRGHADRRPRRGAASATSCRAAACSSSSPERRCSSGTRTTSRSRSSSTARRPSAARRPSCPPSSERLRRRRRDPAAAGVGADPRPAGARRAADARDRRARARRRRRRAQPRQRAARPRPARRDELPDRRRGTRARPGRHVVHPAQRPAQRDGGAGRRERDRRLRAVPRRLEARSSGRSRGQGAGPDRGSRTGSTRGDAAGSSSRATQSATCVPISAPWTSARRKWIPDHTRASTTSFLASDARVKLRDSPLGVVSLQARSLVPKKCSSVLVNAPARPEAPDEWSGYGGVAISGSQSGIGRRSGIPVQVRLTDGRDRPPEAPEGLVVPDADGRVGRGHVGHREEARVLLQRQPVPVPTACGRCGSTSCRCGRPSSGTRSSAQRFASRCSANRSP